MKTDFSVIKAVTDIVFAVATVAVTVFLILPATADFTGITNISGSQKNASGISGVSYVQVRNTSNSDVSEAVETKEITSENIAEKTEKPAPKSEDETTFSDLKAMQEEFISAFAGKEPAGTVSTQFFKTDGATDILGNVAIKNATATKKPDFAALLKAGTPLQKADFSLPTVLIFHTHTTESYLQTDDRYFYDGYQTRSTDSNRNMVRVGNEICKSLENNGIGVIHDTEIYDEQYNGAYERSRKSVLAYLEKYPTIQIVLDVHRDAIYYSDTNHCKPTAEINGEKCAQIMIITGAEEGQISDFPNWEENLRFALELQKVSQDMYSGLMRPIYFCQRKYNMDTAKCSLLLEIGSDANTLEEACRSAEMLGEALSKIIKTTNKK